MKIAYIAGPYRADTVSGIRANIERARVVAEKHWKMGYAVFCPHMNSALMDGIIPDEQFLKAGLNFLDMCDTIVMMKGWEKSAGSRDELEMAKLGKMEIIYE